MEHNKNLTLEAAKRLLFYEGDAGLGSEAGQYRAALLGGRIYGVHNEVIAPYGGESARYPYRVSLCSLARLAREFDSQLVSFYGVNGIVALNGILAQVATMKISRILEKNAFHHDQIRWVIENMSTVAMDVFLVKTFSGDPVFCYEVVPVFSGESLDLHVGSDRIRSLPVYTRRDETPEDFFDTFATAGESGAIHFVAGLEAARLIFFFAASVFEHLSQDQEKISNNQLVRAIA